MGDRAEDRLLADRIAAGDDEALALVYQEHGAKVYSLALTLIHDSSLADDITQDVFVSLWQRPERYDSERGSLRSLLCTMTHSKAVDLFRQRDAANRRENRVAREGDAAEPDAADLVADQVEASSIRAAVNQLPEDQRQAILLAYFGGRTYREVALDLGIPEGTAKSRLRAGLQQLSRSLNSEGTLSWT